MKTVAIVVIVLVVLLVIALVVLAGRRNKRRAALRERFGPEYDLAVKRGKDRRAVEQRLEALAEQRDRLDIHEVAPQEHVRFSREWESAQARFVDDPGQAVADADGLVNSVLRSRGYPVESFDDRAALVATDHQDVVESYREAHDTFAAHLQGGTGDTEGLRQAFLGYREVFGRLNVPAGGDGDRAVQAAPERPAVEAAPAAPVEAPVPPRPVEQTYAEPLHAERGDSGRFDADRDRAERDRADRFDAERLEATPAQAPGGRVDGMVNGGSDEALRPDARPHDGANQDLRTDQTGTESVLAAPIERGPVPPGAAAAGPARADGALTEDVGRDAEGAQPDGTRPDRPVGAHRADPA